MSDYSVINPYNDEVIKEITYTSRAETQQILKRVVKGQQIIANMTPYERSQVLMKLAELLERDKNKIAQQITLEMGKTLTDSLIEMDRAITTVKTSSYEALRIYGEVIPTDIASLRRDKKGIVEHFPVGVVLAITPFNFPINLSVHKIGPAIAAGNAVLFKPGPQNILSGQMLTNLCWEAGMSPDYFQIINPDIPVLSELVASPDIQCISFTGGVVAARAIAKNAGIKKLLFELGGNDPLIVMPDGDIDLAVKTAVNQRFWTAGQRCTASKKVFLHEKVYEEFKKKLVAASINLKIGDPTKGETIVGPVVNKKAADEVMRRIEQAVKAGAKVLLGNKREGNIIYPTILENVPASCDLVKEETFGPVIPLISFKDIEEVIEQVNSSSFGLQAGVFTQNLQTIKLLFKKLEVGALAVNDGPGFRAEHIPFGGVKNSGLGREGVAYAIREMSYLKTLIL
ncbi:MAG: aldehyde dehydrogenase family protein [Bacteriovoracaceae bacterium]|nr:aldehyde dehydrogenase family protein [Bacteriovoracaceae bacterium]